MLSVLGMLALVWVCLVVAICAICAAGGIADDQSDDWHREQQLMSEDAVEDERGAA